MIIILGTPGAGKTTQSQLLANYLGCPWFSMGGLIRDKAKGHAREEMLEGKIIEDKDTLDILAEALAPIDTANQECIVEGNPRSIPQAQWWVDQINAGEVNIRGVIHLVVAPSVAKGRLDKRGRIDDGDGEVINKRFEEYHNSINPTLDYLESHGVKVYEIDAGNSIEQIAKDIHKALGIDNKK